MGERKNEIKEDRKEEIKEVAEERIIEVPINMELINQKINQLTVMINHTILQNQEIMKKLGIEIKSA